MVDTTTLIAIITAVPALMAAAGGLMTGILAFIRTHTHSQILLDLTNKMGKGAAVDEQLAKQIADQSGTIKDVVDITAQLDPSAGKQIADHEVQLKQALSMINALTAKVASLEALIPK